MDRKKSPQEIAAILNDIYNSEFGSKTRGRFQIPRERLRVLAGRRYLQDSIIKETDEYCRDFDLVLLNLDDTLIVLNEQTLRRYRRPPENLIEGFEAISTKGKDISRDVRIRKNFGEDEEPEEWYNGTVQRVYNNGKIFVIYDDEDYEITSVDDIEILEDKA